MGARKNIIVSRWYESHISATVQEVLSGIPASITSQVGLMDVQLNWLFVVSLRWELSTRTPFVNL